MHDEDEEQGMEVGLQNDHVHYWSAKADQVQHWDNKQDGGVCIEKISKHDRTKQTDRMKV